MSLVNPKQEGKALELEDRNFRVNSNGWTKKTSPNGQEYLEAPTKDMWELINCEEHPKLNCQQLFTWDAAIRETEKAGKRIPSDEEWSQLLKTKQDMPNPVFAGYRGTNGSFYYLSDYGYFWSSLQSGSDAWYRNLNSGYGTVRRNTNDKAYGFSVRCLKD